MHNIGLNNQDEVTSSVSRRMTEQRSTIDLLRAQTAAHHHGLESVLRIQDRLSGSETRDPLIAGYRAFYREAGMALNRHLRDVPDLAFSSRFRCRRIPRENGSFGHGTVPADPVFPAIATKAEALGALYVLEGSTLGGRTILKTLRSRGVSTDGLQFLDPYGTATGARWRSFLEILERETACNRTAINACVSGAIKAFAFAATCLREERTN